MNDRCYFCNSNTINIRKTLYGVSICEECHNTITERGGRSIAEYDLTTWDTKKQEYGRFLKEKASSRIRSPRKPFILEALSKKHRDVLWNYRSGFILSVILSNRQRPEQLSLPFLTDLILHNVDETPYSETKETVKRESFLIRILAFLAPNFYRELLNKQTNEKIDEELRKSVEEIKILKKDLQECAEEINRLNQEVERKWEQEKPVRIEKHIKHKLAERYPQKVRKIIERAKEENILLFEYYLNDYPPDWEYRAKKVRERDSYTCQKCGGKNNLHVHHKVPVLAGGYHFLDNLIALCDKCHLEEHPMIWKMKYLDKKESQ